MYEKRFGLDVGTFNVRLSEIDTGRILSEKNAITIKNNKVILGYGDAAYEMFEKSPENVEVIFPVKGGVISDADKMQLILEYLFKKINGGKIIKNSEFLISVPTNATEVEKRAFHELVATSKIKPKNISVIDKCVADLVALGIDIKSPEGNLIINLGADNTDISVLSIGGIVTSHSMKIGGNTINESIAQAVRKEQNALIGVKSAEQLKITLADLGPDPARKDARMFARALETGLPVMTVVPSEMINHVIGSALEPVVDMVKYILERTPPELAADINYNGIYLLGGTANIRNIEVLFGEGTGLKIKTINNPEASTIRGITKVFSNSRFDTVRYYPKEKIYN